MLDRLILSDIGCQLYVLLNVVEFVQVCPICISYVLLGQIELLYRLFIQLLSVP